MSVPEMVPIELSRLSAAHLLSPLLRTAEQQYCPECRQNTDPTQHRDRRWVGRRINAGVRLDEQTGIGWLGVRGRGHGNAWRVRASVLRGASVRTTGVATTGRRSGVSTTVIVALVVASLVSAVIVVVASVGRRRRGCLDFAVVGVDLGGDIGPVVGRDGDDGVVGRLVGDFGPDVSLVTGMAVMVAAIPEGGNGDGDRPVRVRRRPRRMADHGLVTAMVR